MRILFIAPSAYLLGGVQDWLSMTVDGLRRRNYEVIVGLPDNHFHSLSKYNNYYSNLHAVGFTNRSGTHEGRIHAIKKFLLKIQPDVIIGANIGNLYEAFSRVKGQLPRAKIVMALHAIESNYYEDIREYKQLIDGIITTSKLNLDIIRLLTNFDADRIFYAPCGIKVDTNNQYDRRSPNKRLRIVWVGRIDTKQKRVSDLVSFVKILDNKGAKFNLSVVGEGPYMNSLRKSMDSWISAGIVEMHGLIPKDQISSFYKGKDILLITSEWETGPIVAWEAMAKGLVIVSSRYVGYAKEGSLLERETALMFEIGDMEDAAQQVLRLYDENLFMKLSCNGRSLVLNRYSEDSSVDQWEKAIVTVSQMEPRYCCRDYTPTIVDASGRLEILVGSRLSEVIRSWTPLKFNAYDPGSEWPHSTQGITQQTELLNYAKEIDRTKKIDWRRSI